MVDKKGRSVGIPSPDSMLASNFLWSPIDPFNHVVKSARDTMMIDGSVQYTHQYSTPTYPLLLIGRARFES
jgi:hypothetical protein